MKIEHVALWTFQLERQRDFYVEHFGCTAGPKYTNTTTDFSSYFLTFSSGARLELMTKPSLVASSPPHAPAIGYAHIALALGSEQAVREFTQNLRDKGISVVSEPRLTGDDYYEGVVLDLDGNSIELTV
jgi:lactoylglutathione lyase